MEKVRVRPLRPREKKKLLRSKRQRTNATNTCRARIVLLSRGGMSNREIAERVDRIACWARTVIHRFNDEGVDGMPADESTSTGTARSPVAGTRSSRLPQPGSSRPKASAT